MCYRQWRIKTDLATHSHFAMTLLRCLLWTVAHWRPLLVGKVTSSYWVCVLGGRGGGVREETSPAEVEEKPNRHETPNCEQLRGSRAWPLTSGRPIDKSSTFYSPVQQDGEGVEPRGGGPGTAGGGARGALRITVNVFGESFWETQKKTNMQIICRVKFIVSFSINEKYADFFPLGFFVLKCIS